MTEYIKRSSDNVVFSEFPAGSVIDLTSQGLLLPYIHDGYNDTTHEIIDVTPPVEFISRAMAHDGSWSIIDQIRFDEKIALRDEKRTAEIPGLKLLVIEIMIEKQNAGLDFNGMPIETDVDGLALITGAKVKGRPADRKFVPRTGGGTTAVLTKQNVDDIFDAVDAFKQDLMNHAFDLLELLNAGTWVDINNGWPS